MNAPRLPRVWLLADRRGWAFDQEAQAMVHHLQGRAECRIAYVAEEPDLLAWDFDLVWVFFWGETWHERFVDDPRRVVLQVASHRWQLEAAWGRLDPATFADRHLGRAGHVVTISRRLRDLLQPHVPITLVPQGIDPERWPHPADLRTGPLAFGWAGNESDPCKGLADVLRPACDGFVDLQVAGGALDTGEMAAFYRDLDVLCIASEAEGGPLPLLEAMACGAFVVTTDVGITPEVIEHGVTGLLVERNPAAFRAALHWCQGNPERVRQGGRRGAERVRTERTWARTIAARAEVIQRAFAAVAPRPAPTAAAADPTARDYAAHLLRVNQDGLSDDAWRAAASYYRAELQPLLPPDRDAAICEVGFGLGHLLRWLHEQGYRDLCAADRDPDLCRLAAQRLPGARVHCTDATAFLRQHPGRFDLLLAYDLLEHFDLPAAAEFAAAARAALRPGGTAVFRTPNMANVLGGYSRFMDLTHRTGFTEQSLRQLLLQAGFLAVDLVQPDWRHDPTMAERLQRSRAFHRELFALQDRSTPRCFDKNLVVAAGAAALVGTAP